MIVAIIIGFLHDNLIWLVINQECVEDRVGTMQHGTGSPVSPCECPVSPVPRLDTRSHSTSLGFRHSQNKHILPEPKLRKLKNDPLTEK